MNLLPVVQCVSQYQQALVLNKWHAFRVLLICDCILLCSQCSLERVGLISWLRSLR